MASGPQDFPFGIMDVVELLHLKIRRRQANSVYVNCPICGDNRGKMNVNYEKNVWRCNYCDERGGMLALYAKVYGISTSDAYREICEALHTGTQAPDYTVKQSAGPKRRISQTAEPKRASHQDTHKTLSALLELLALAGTHRNKLRQKGLSDEQISTLGCRSTPPPNKCRPFANWLIKQGCTVEGVPGFIVDDDGKWTVNFHKWDAGILTPCIGEDGLIWDLEISLNKPVILLDANSEKKTVNTMLLSSAPKADEVIIPQSELASIQEIHRTLSTLFDMLSLSDAHRKHLKSKKRGLNDEQIEKLGYKSTPPPSLCQSLTERLIRQGCAVKGVPGFYIDDEEEWTVKFGKRTAGIIIPVRGIDGLIRGAQIRLDVPIKNPNDPPEKEGTKYLWFSTSSEYMGVGSGSPIHFVGKPYARVVYAIEGFLKADVTHCLTGRSFAAMAGANNVEKLGPLFAMLAQNGTEMIVEAADMDKFRNEQVSRGASKIYLMARRYGLEYRRLTWNPNYKGMDDWQLALRYKSLEKEEDRMNFKERYLSGLCEFDCIDNEVESWHKGSENGIGLVEHLGMTEQEYGVWLRDGDEAVKRLLDAQRRRQHFRIYQLDFKDGIEPKPFAFLGIEGLHKAGYEQPPAAEYCLVCNAEIVCPQGQEEEKILCRIFEKYNDTLPEEYPGRSLSPSDVVELYDEEKRRYFYRSEDRFVPVRFSPLLARPIMQKALPGDAVRNEDN